MDIKSDEAIEDLLHGRLKIIQKKEGYRFSIDAVLLANFARLKKGENAADLGTGSGVIPLILSWRKPDHNITGIEISSEIAEMARKSVEINAMTNRISIIEGDVKKIKELSPPERFGVAIANPPYGKVDTGRLNPKLEKAEARHEIAGGLDDFIGAAAYLTKYRGRIYVIYPARRCADLLCSLREKGFEPKRMRAVYSVRGESARLVLVEGVKGGGVEMDILKPLYIYGDDRSYTAEVEAMYR